VEDGYVIVPLFVLYATAAVMLFKYRRDIADAIEAFKDNLPKGGGPKTPMHPSPINDSALLRARKQRKNQ
jgi:hypothetical protein